MMGKKKLRDIVVQLKKQVDSIASLDARLDTLHKQNGNPSVGNEIRESLARILHISKKPVRKKQVNVN